MRTPTPPIPRDLLSLLRTVESTPRGDLEWARHCTRQQAMILCLQAPPPLTVTSLAQAFDIPIDIVDGIPVDGTAFPTRDGWRIHVAAGLSPRARVRRAVHELKHIIDHPVRSRDGANGFTPSDFEHLAEFFADCVLPEASP